MWAARLLIILWWRWVRARVRLTDLKIGHYKEMLKGEMMSGLLQRVPIALLLLLLVVGGAKAQASYDLRSPNGRVELRIRTANGIRYDVLLGGRAILQDCALLMDVEHKKLGVDAKVLKHKESSQDRVLEPVVRQKFAKIRENYMELHLDFDGGYGVTFRAYKTFPNAHDGAADGAWPPAAMWSHASR